MLINWHETEGEVGLRGRGSAKYALIFGREEENKGSGYQVLYNFEPVKLSLFNFLNI